MSWNKRQAILKRRRARAWLRKAGRTGSYANPPAGVLLISAFMGPLQGQTLTALIWDEPALPFQSSGDLFNVV